MSDVDIAIEGFTGGESGFPAFEIWLKIGHMLNKIIDFYRPIHQGSTGWEGEYPGLEEMIDEVRGWNLPTSMLATLHLYYLSVGILSHRSRGLKEIPRGMNSNTRQRLMAIEIIRIMNAPKHTMVHPLPVVPYSISLSLSVSYLQLRQAQLEHQQADAREEFRTCCRILQNLRRTWCSADVMATLAKKVLDEIDRAPSLASFRIPRSNKYARPSDIDSQQPEQGIAHPSACTFGAFPVEHPGQNSETPNGQQQNTSPTMVQQQQPVMNGINLFNNMDDVFGTFMDPNYPMNLDDVPFNLTPWDWTASEIAVGT